MTSLVKEFIQSSDINNSDDLKNVFKIELLQLIDVCKKSGDMNKQQFLEFATRFCHLTEWNEICDFYHEEYGKLVSILKENKIALLTETIRLMKEMLEKDDDPVAKLEYLEELENAEVELNELLGLD
jgi:hypothetical protein